MESRKIERHGSPLNEVTRAKAGKRAGIVGICANLMLFAVKLAAGVLSGSVSVVADAVNNLSDAGSSIIVMLGYILSAKPADKKHPYGHARIEYLCTLFISIIITFLGYELISGSVKNIVSGGEGAVFVILPAVIMGASVAVKLFLAVYFRSVGKRIGSASLSASAVDSLGDVGATAAVIIGMIISPYTGPATDGVLGCLIGLYIFIMGVKLIYESSNTLLGVAPGPELVSTIVKKLKSYEGVMGIHDLVLHNYGEGRFFASVHLEVDSEVDIMVSHDRIDNIEADFAREMGIHLVIHLDPVEMHNEKLNSLKASVRGAIDEISSEISSPVSMHDFRAVFGITHTNLIFDVVVAHDLPVSEKELCARISSEIKRIDKSLNTVITVDRDYTSTTY